ncbi:hypothetical protein APSETT444_002649 [Aspergillus pseudonomiae]
MQSAEPSPRIGSIKNAIDAFRQGEFIIVLDAADRENEGDLIIAGESVTEAQMAFLVRYTRQESSRSPKNTCFQPTGSIRLTPGHSGLVCAAVTPEIARRAGLPQMVTNNTDPKGTAYTVSIDSNDPSITTGISARDRAMTCRALASVSVRADDFRRPGHIMPLQAREGGVRERMGHTEAAIEFCLLAGKHPVGILAELVKDGESIEGEPNIHASGMMRRDECLEFGKRWGITVCTIQDLVAYLNERGTGNI